MRRSEREIGSRTEIDAIIRGSEVCRLALALNDQPYLVPVSFGYDGSAIFFHTAREGKKIAYFEGNGRVCFEFEGGVEVRTDHEQACRWSYRYQSVIGFGTIREVLDSSAREYGLNEIMRHYSGKTWSFDPGALARTRVWRIDVDSMTGKKS